MTYPFGSRRRATPTHEKSMGSYELFAWRDAMAIAEMVENEFEASKARQMFEGFNLEQVIEFETKHRTLIGDFIQKSESQRPSFLRRISKDADDNTRTLFLVLSIIGVLRAKTAMEIRDFYRTVLAPGRGNRITTAALYDFTNKMRDIYDYSWPTEIFEAMGIDDCDDDED